MPISFLESGAHDCAGGEMAHIREIPYYTRPSEPGWVIFSYNFISLHIFIARVDQKRMTIITCKLLYFWQKIYMKNLFVNPSIKYLCWHIKITMGCYSLAGIFLATAPENDIQRYNQPHFFFRCLLFVVSLEVCDTHLRLYGFPDVFLCP